MLDRGVERFISSLQETPAKTIVSLERAQARTESGSSLLRSVALPKSAGLILSSARTSRGTRTDSLKPSSRHWSDWATALRQEYSARPRRATPCGASDCSSWLPEISIAPPVEGKAVAAPTFPAESQLDAETAMWPGPRTITGGPETAERKQELGRLESGGGDLQAAAQEWMAPVADDTGTRSKRYDQGGMALSMQVANWAGPAAQNHKGSSEGSIVRSDGKSRDDILSYQAEQFFRLPSSPDQLIAGGSMSSTDSPSSYQLSVKRKLNPIFVEALMRWPIGLSGFERQEMAWTRWWLLMPSFLSALYSEPEGEMQMDLFGAAA